jgi:hypothetical protein
MPHGAAKSAWKYAVPSRRTARNTSERISISGVYEGDTEGAMPQTPSFLSVRPSGGAELPEVGDEYGRRSSARPRKVANPSPSG